MPGERAKMSGGKFAQDLAGSACARARLFGGAKVFLTALRVTSGQAAATVTAASSAMPACSRLIVRPLTSQRPSGWRSAAARQGPPGSRCAVRRWPSLDGLIMTQA